MGLQDKVKSATRGSKDIDVLLDRKLLEERTVLLAELDGSAKDPRVAQTKSRKAQKALDEFMERVRDSVVWIRVVEVSDAEWRQAQSQNPMPTDKSKRTPIESMYGYNAVGAAIDVVEHAGLLLDGDETEKPTDAEWKSFWGVANSGDIVRLMNAVIELQEASGLRGYGAAKKA